MIAVTEYVKCEMCENNFCLNKIVSSKDGEYCKKCYEKIQLLLDKAREEGREEGSKKLYRSISKELYKLYSDIEYLGDLRDEVYDLSDKYEKLSKLKDNK